MSVLKLLISMAPGPEAGLVRALVRLHERDDGSVLDWCVVEGGDHDAVMSDDLTLRCSDRPHLYLVDELTDSSQNASLITRPLRAQPFYDWLDSVANQSRATTPIEPAPRPLSPPAAPPRVVGGLVTTDSGIEELSPLQQILARRAAQSQKANAVDNADVKPAALFAPEEKTVVQQTAQNDKLPVSMPDVTDDMAVRYRLTKWPPTIITRNDPLRVRMATYLSKRAMLVHELALVCKTTLDECKNFLRVLYSVGLLQVIERAPQGVAGSILTAPLSSTNIATVSVSSVAPAASSLPRSVSPNSVGVDSKKTLVFNIRKRLGLV